MDIKNILDNFEISVDTQFPPPGDWHGINTAAFYGFDKIAEIYKRDKLEYKKYRSKGKGMGLGLNYGGSWKVIKEGAGVSESEAKKLYDNYFQGLPVFNLYIKKLTKRATENKYIRTFMGRRIYISALEDKDNWKVFAAGLRHIKNYPIQAAGGELVKLILIKTGEYIEEHNLYDLQDNNITKKYIKRIVAIKENQITDDLIATLEQIQEGHTKLIVTNEQGKVVQEWDKLLQMDIAIVNKYQMEIIH